MNISTMGGPFDDWVAALEARHLADLRVPEVTRALRALSSAYVERRRRAARAHGGARERARRAGQRRKTRGIRAVLRPAAFHRRHRGHSRARARQRDAPKTILDLGCGTGAAGAAWALACRSMPAVVGIDRHPWAIDEAQWTYQQLGVHGRARQGDVARSPAPRRGEAVVAAYVLNELPDAARITVEKTLRGNGRTRRPCARHRANRARRSHRGGMTLAARFSASADGRTSGGCRSSCRRSSRSSIERRDSITAS